MRVIGLKNKSLLWSIIADKLSNNPSKESNYNENAFDAILKWPWIIAHRDNGSGNSFPDAK